MRTRLNNLCVIPLFRLAMFAGLGSAVLAPNALAQSAREVRGASPYVAIENEPAPKLRGSPSSRGASPGSLLRVKRLHTGFSGDA